MENIMQQNQKNYQNELTQLKMELEEKRMTNVR